MTNRLVFVAVLAIACNPFGGGPLVPLREVPGTATHAVTVDGDDRTFLLHVPAQRPRNRFGRAEAYPLLIVMHGSSADADEARRMSGMDSLADAHRFLVAYPNGVTGIFGSGSDWNAGDCCGAASRAHVNDVGFLRAIVTGVARQMPVDRDRIYVAGFSDGGRMAYRAACEMATDVAAIGVVSGSLVSTTCKPARPVAVIAFHGTADDQVAYDDSARTPPPLPVPAVAMAMPPSIRFWTAVDRCRSIDTHRLTTHVTRTRFGACADGDNVELFTIDGAGHGWPGDRSSGEIDASPLMVDFFLRHTRHRGGATLPRIGAPRDTNAVRDLH